MAVAVLFKTHEKPAEKIVYILEPFDLPFEGKTRKHVLLPALALACAGRDRLQALAANVTVKKHKVESGVSSASSARNFGTSSGRY